MLGETDRARTIYAEAREVFGDAPDALATVEAAAERAAHRRMIHESVEDFAAALAPRRALAGLDLGDAHDRGGGVGHAAVGRHAARDDPPDEVHRRCRAAAGPLEARAIGGLILGLPRNMDGSEGPRCQSTRAFARNLARLTELPITFWDERLSTVAAERALLEADASRRRRAEVIDHVAAAYILQGALDRLRHLKGTS